MNKLSTRQVCFFFIALLPVTKLFSLPSLMARICAQDSWIATLINLSLDFITLAFLLYACKKARSNFYQLLTDNFSPLVAKLIYGLYFIYFMSKAVIPISEQKDFVEMTLYTLRPSIFYFLPFFVVCFYTCLKPLRVLGRASDILWMVTLSGVGSLLALSLTNVDFSAILPIGVTGSKIVNASYKSLNWFGDSAYLLFFMGEFIVAKKDKLKIILSFVLGAVIMILFMVIFYSVFSYIAHRQKFALTEISKYTAVINNIGRFDYIGIFMILISNIFALITPLFMATRILKTIFNFKSKLIPSIIVTCIQIFLMLFLAQKLYGTQKIITEYFSLFFFIMGNVLPITAVFLVNKGVKNETAKN